MEQISGFLAESFLRAWFVRVFDFTAKNAKGTQSRDVACNISTYYSYPVRFVKNLCVLCG
jgi:hypothetical protein